MITASTITDEQIRALGTQLVADGKYSTAMWCDYALISVERAKRCDIPRGCERDVSRARCAEILSARIGGVPVTRLDDTIDSISIDGIEWLGRSLCVVTWQFTYDSLPRVSLVSYEFEAADPSVGQGAGILTDSDAPRAVEDHVAEVAMERLIDSYDEGPEYEHEDRYDYEPDTDDRQDAF